MQKTRLLELAIKGLEAERTRIDKELADLRNGMGPGVNGSPESMKVMATPRAKQKRRMSAAAKKKISEAMKRSHAARKAAAKK
jgi:hypothetical protein